MPRVVFIDTSILCNLVPVPKLDQNRSEVISTMARYMDDGPESVQLILPITTVIETGNHIAQVSDGRVRRQAAERFDELLRMMIAEQAPWTLHEINWDKTFLSDFLAGGSSQSTYIEHAQNGVGAGDLCILTERDHYSRRTGLNAEIWTLDTGLASHN